MGYLLTTLNYKIKLQFYSVLHHNDGSVYTLGLYVNLTRNEHVFQLIKHFFLQIRKLCEKSSNKRPRFQCVLLLILDKLISMTTGQTEKLDLCHLQLTLIKSVQTSTIQVC